MLHNGQRGEITGQLARPRIGRSRQRRDVWHRGEVVAQSQRLGSGRPDRGGSRFVDEQGADIGEVGPGHFREQHHRQQRRLPVADSEPADDLRRRRCMAVHGKGERSGKPHFPASIVERRVQRRLGRLVAEMGQRGSRQYPGTRVAAADPDVQSLRRSDLRHACREARFLVAAHQFEDFDGEIGQHVVRGQVRVVRLFRARLQQPDIAFALQADGPEAAVGEAAPGHQPEQDYECEA